MAPGMITAMTPVNSSPIPRLLTAYCPIVWVLHMSYAGIGCTINLPSEAVLDGTCLRGRDVLIHQRAARPLPSPCDIYHPLLPA
jgi:hypothetical protein